jgi:hypothetical protein
MVFVILLKIFVNLEIITFIFFFPAVKHFKLIRRIFIVLGSCFGFHYSALLYCGLQRFPSVNYNQRGAKFC